MINFEKLFIEYARKRVESGGLSRGHEALAALYDEWKAAPCAALDNKTPSQYIETVTDGKTLVEFLKAGKSELVMERISRVPACAAPLYTLIEESAEDELTGIAIELLSELDGIEPTETYMHIVKEGQSEAELIELCIDRLKLHAAKIKDRLLAEAGRADQKSKAVFAEILIEAGRDERTFNLLTGLFVSGKNYPLYADYLGKYGDERAVAFLYPALDKADYVDYIEIKNAIERLGGTVDEELRDFTEDPTRMRVECESHLKK